MKAADLMIGDWVVKPSGHIRTMGRAEFSNESAGDPANLISVGKSLSRIRKEMMSSKE